MRRRGRIIRRLMNAFLVATGAVTMACQAAAGSSTMGVTITSDREPDDFADPKALKYELNWAHTFDGGLIVGGLFQYRDLAFSDQASQNLEGTLGYRVPLTTTFSLTGSVGIGEHWRQNPAAAFPYYVLRIGGDLDLNQTVTWNVVSFRYRDGFDPEITTTPRRSPRALRTSSTGGARFRRRSCAIGEKAIRAIRASRSDSNNNSENHISARCSARRAQE